MDGCLTTASPLQLHLLHVDLTGCHPDGDRVDDSRVLKERYVGSGVEERRFRVSLEMFVVHSTIIPHFLLTNLV